MLKHYLSRLRRADSEWYATDANPDDANQSLLPPSLSLLLLVLGLATLFAGGCAVGWW